VKALPSAKDLFEESQPDIADIFMGQSSKFLNAWEQKQANVRTAMPSALTFGQE
jgi:hypothetical protein